MSKKFLIAGIPLLVALLLTLVAAFWFREALVTVAANRLFSGQQIRVTALHGLHLGTRHATIAEMELLLPNGQQLLVTGIEAQFTFITPLGSPQVESLQLGGVHLLTAAVSPPQPDSTAKDGKLFVSDLLQLLREFPITSITISELTLPQRHESLVVTLRRLVKRLDLQVDSGNLHLLADFTQADAISTALMQITLTHHDVAVGNMHVTLQPAAATFDFNGQGHLAFANLHDFLNEIQQAPLPLTATSLDWQLAGTLADDLRGTFAGAPKATTPTVFVLSIQAGSTVTLPADLASGLGELVIGLSDKAELSFTTGAAAGLRAGSLPLQLRGSWRQKPFHLESLLTVGVNGENGEYQLKTKGLAMVGLASWLPVFDIDASLALDHNMLAFNTPILLRNAPADAGINIVGSYQLATGEANMHLRVPQVEFVNKSRPLSAWLSGWPYAFDLLSGSLAADMDLQWRVADKAAAGAMTANLTATLKDVAGSYDDIFFRGLNGELHGSMTEQAAFTLSTPPLALTIASVDIGMPVDNLAVKFQFDRATQRLLVSSFNAETLGGTVFTKEASYDFNSAHNNVNMRFSGLRLDRVLALVKYDGIEAAGAVSGELPLKFAANGVQVAAGSLHSDIPGGSIHYLAGAAAGVQGNPGLELMNKALSNYHFETLTSRIDYAKDGELALSVHLQGNNPDMDKGQRINLNLNLSDNIPALLKSLQATRVIEDFLEKKYQ